MHDDARKQTTEPEVAAPSDVLIQRFSPLPTGTRVGDLSIQSVLGAGEFGITYIGVPEGANRRYVIKEYLPRSIAFRDGLTVRVSSANTPLYAAGLDRFLTEARALAKIKHPAIVSVFSVFEGNGTGYCVMPHEVGRDVGIWLHELRRPLTQAEFDKFCEPLLDGLAALHAKGLQHLDIQPATIIMRESGSPVLVDFGSGRVAMRKRLNASPPTDALPYMAPEVATGDQTLIGPRSDIYSLAAVLYQMATGTVPPPASGRALRDDLAPVADAQRSKLRASFAQAIDSGLHFRPDDRPHDIALWKDDLFRPDGAAGRKPAPKEPAAEPEAPVGTALAEAAQLDAGSGIAEPLMDNPAFRPVFFGLAGAVCGALVGALAAIVIASVVLSSCAADSCVAPFVPYTTALGTLFGIVAGARYGRQTAPGAAQPHGEDGEF
jgi:hypothetical protein